jgi:uncharacterized protein involved in exopolysaccharide biosynthesis
MKSFLAYRRETETAAITESINILDKSIGALESQIHATIAQLPTRRVERPAARARPRPTVPAGPSPQTMVELSRLKSALELRQQDVARLAGAQTQQLSEAQARLNAALTMYTEGHPTVSALRKTVAQLSRDSPELTAARRDAQRLQAEHDALSVKVGIATEIRSLSMAMADELAEPAVDPFSLLNIGDENDPVSLRLRVEISQLAALREHANAARAELSSAEAGFKYRYSVTRPPRVPRGPSGPNVSLIVLVGALAGVMLAVAAAMTRRAFRA